MDGGPGPHRPRCAGRVVGLAAVVSGCGAPVAHRRRGGRSRPVRADLLDRDVLGRDAPTHPRGSGLGGRHGGPVRHRRGSLHQPVEHHRARHQRAHRPRQCPGLRLDRERAVRRGDRVPTALDDGSLRARARCVRPGPAVHDPAQTGEPGNGTRPRDPADPGAGVPWRAPARHGHQSDLVPRPGHGAAERRSGRRRGRRSSGCSPRRARCPSRPSARCRAAPAGR